MPKTRRPLTERERRWRTGCTLVGGLAIAIFIIVALVTQHGSGSGSGSNSNAEWQLMRSQLGDHVRELDDAQTAVNLQAAANARLKIVKDCREAGGYQAGNTSDEQAIRRVCAALGYPLP